MYNWDLWNKFILKVPNVFLFRNQLQRAENFSITLEYESINMCIWLYSNLFNIFAEVTLKILLLFGQTVHCDLMW